MSGASVPRSLRPHGRKGLEGFPPGFPLTHCSKIGSVSIPAAGSVQRAARRGLQANANALPDLADCRRSGTYWARPCR